MALKAAFANPIIQTWEAREGVMRTENLPITVPRLVRRMRAMLTGARARTTRLQLVSMLKGQVQERMEQTAPVTSPLANWPLESTS
jgi:hypothetical protein